MGQNMGARSCKHLRAAVIDVGSNSIKFMLGYQEGSLLTIHREEAVTTRLGHKLALTGKICYASRLSTLKALRRCKREADQFGVEKIIAVGTSALRSATNRATVLEPAKKILGTPIRVISGKLEGELVYAGTTSYHHWQRRNIIVIDIGGGSVEFVYGTKGKLARVKSLPLGCVRVRDALLHDKQPVPPELLEAAISDLTNQMQRGFKDFIGLPAIILTTGGTATTLTSLHCSGQPRVRVHQLEGIAIRHNELKNLLNFLATASLRRLRAHPRIPYRRADVITAGACALYAAMQVLNAKTVHCTTRGLRYGVWQKMLAPQPFKAVHHED
jgi:exopolyphosphatase / guanosine-5'-triphosphate,3'-diphosphate pyrophosphatase